MQLIKKGRTPLDKCIHDTKQTQLFRKHGGETGEELNAEGK